MIADIKDFLIHISKIYETDENYEKTDENIGYILTDEVSSFIKIKQLDLKNLQNDLSALEQKIKELNTPQSAEKVKFDEETMQKKIDDAVEKLASAVSSINDLTIPIPQDHPIREALQESQFKIFWHLYCEYISNSISNSSAFLAALPCCLDEKNRLTLFKKDNQKVFDSALLAAAKIKAAPDELPVSDEVRLAVLQYVVLLDIKAAIEQTLESTPSPSSSPSLSTHGVFKQNSFLATLSLLEVQVFDALPKELNIKQIDTQELNKLWETAYIHLDNNFSFMKENNRGMFISAIYQLATSIPQPRIMMLG